MYLSYKWLKQYLPEIPDLVDKELQDRITSSLAEVEETKTLGENLSKIVVGDIKKIKPHPGSDKNSVLVVDTGDKRSKTIVCSAKNIKEGQKVPVALPGGQVLHPKDNLGEQKVLSVKEVEIKGEKSQGMLCSLKELGLSDDHEGIWILSEDTEVGTDLVEHIQDVTIEIENKSLTHRPDCFSHLGIARELSAIFRTPFKYEESDEPLIPTKSLPLVVKVQDQKLCKRYTAIVLQGIKVKESPLWLKLRLLACGVRPVNNIVDATNYIMLDMGQPLHAFDYEKLSAPRIIVRTAKRGEKIETLDGKKRDLNSTHLLICDPEQAIGVAGVMGGANTEISNSTKDIIIESANFEMYNNRRTGKELGIRSEANTRFEKGPDPNITLPALVKAVELILEIAGGEIASEVIDIYPEEVKETEIDFEIGNISKLLGIDVSKEQSIDIFKSLHFEIISPEASTNSLKLKVPTFRRDLLIEEDLLEEVARIYGYDQFEPSLPSRDLTPAPQNLERIFERKVKTTLSSLGFDELYTYSFSGEESYSKTLLDTKNCLKLKNPVSPELEYLKNSLIPNLLEKVVINQANFDTLNIYELSRAYQKELSTEGIPNQPKNIAGLISKNADEEELLLSLKELLAEFFEKIIIYNVTFERTKNIDYLHPSQQWFMKSKNKVIGHIGNIHPLVKANWDIKANTTIFVLDFQTLFDLQGKKRKYKQVPKYPQVTRDLSFWIDRSIEASVIEEKLMNIKSKNIASIRIRDIYKTTKKKDKKSITIQIVLQSKTHTLTEKDITEDMKLVAQAVEKMKGKIRKK